MSPAIGASARRGWWPAAVVFALVVAMETSNAFGVLTAYIPISPFQLVLAGAAVVALFRVLIDRTSIPLTPIVGAGALVVAVAISYLGSHLHPDVTRPGVIDSLAQLVFVAVMVVLGARGSRWWLVGLAFVVPMAVIGLVSALNEWVLPTPTDLGGFATITDYLGVGTTTARHSGPLPDPNFWGRFLIVGFPFALALLWHAKAVLRGSARLAAYAGLTLAVIGLLMGVYLTGSRGTFIALFVGVVAFYLAMGVSVRTVLLAGLASLPILAVPGVGSRLASIAGLAGEAQVAAVDYAVIERLATYQIATRMIEQSPITGVGPDGYFNAFPEFAGNTTLTLERIVAPHNLYLGLWAETGIIGLLTWMVILVGAMWLAWRASRLALVLPAAEQVVRRPYAVACLVAIASWMLASVFLHLSYARLILIVVVMSSLLLHECLEVAPRGALAPRLVLPNLHIRLVGAVALAAVLVGGGAAARAQGAAPTGKATVVGYLQPWENSSTYGVNLRTRTSVVPTYAVILTTAAHGTIDAQGDSLSGLVEITATGIDQASARDTLNAGVAAGRDALDTTGLSDLYKLTLKPVATTAEGPELRDVAVAGLLGGVLGGGLVSAAAALWSLGRRFRREVGA